MNRTFLAHSLALAAAGGLVTMLLGANKCGPVEPTEPICAEPAADCAGMTPPVDCAGKWTCDALAECAWVCDDPDPGELCDSDLDCAKGDTCICKADCGPAPIGPTPPVPCLMVCKCVPDEPAPFCFTNEDCAKGEVCICGGATTSAVPNGLIAADCTCQAGDPPPPPLGDCMSDAECGAGEKCSADQCLACESCPMCAVCCGQCVPDTTNAKCFVGGCSGQVCSNDPGVITTCEWKPQYACFKLTQCGAFGPGGTCAWESNPEFEECLASGGPTP
jgi:eight-cysteine-cluster-containing protein